MATVHLYLEDGRELITYPHLDGSFLFRDVPAGVHMLQAYAMGYYYPEVRLDVLQRGGVKASVLTSQGILALPLPLAVKPLTSLQYYEVGDAAL
jgi:hypothetical protein